MKKYTKLLASLILGVSLFISCSKTTPEFKEVSLERWTVSGNAESYEKSAIQYLEKVGYNDSGIEEYKLIYNPDKTLNGKEIRVFKDDSKYPKGSQYKDSQDSLLSYYTFSYNEKGNLVEKKGFDAISNDLLRIETFEYNKNNYPIAKIVKDVNGMPVRKFKYTVDDKGNELQVQVLQADDSELLTEVFKVTKYNSQGHWTEKWGFVNEEPFSYIARKIQYQN